MLLVRRLQLRDEAGQGLIELIIALIFLAIAVAAVIALMASGAISLQRSDQKGTALSLAEKQLETYRTLAYKYIRLNHSSTLNSYYTGANALDSSIPPSTLCTTAGQITPSCIVVDSTPGETVCSSGPACVPSVQSVTGPDGRSYEIDTYISFSQPSSTTSAGFTQTGRVLKNVLEIVRDKQKSGEPILARAGSTFDQSSAATG